MSRTARSVLSSDVASRLSEGLPGIREGSLPSSVHAWPDRVEQSIEFAVRELFDVRHVEWRPTSNTMANAVAMRALTEPGDVVAVQSMDGGANMSYQSEALAGLLNLSTVALPTADEFGIDPNGAARTIKRARPRLVIVGGSKVLFPYPLGEIRAAAEAVGALVMFDAAHVGPFISAGTFPHPLRSGAHVMTTGTHKLMGGPVGGLTATNDGVLARRIRAAVYPQFLQTRDLNKYAAAAISLLELLEYRSGYATAMLANARALGAALTDHGFHVMASHRGFTQTHMIFAETGESAREVASRCEHSGLLLSHTAVKDSAEDRRALRISVAQVTRQGMQAPEMGRLARLIREAGKERADVRDKVRDLALGFARVRFSFDQEELTGNPE